MNKLAPFLFLLFLLSACSSLKNTVYKPSSFEIRFGHLGGFTNLPMEYLINGDRNVFKVQHDTIFCVNKLTREELEGIQCSFNELNFETMHLDVPGDMTYFIRVKTPEYANEVQWYHLSGNAEVKELYSILLTTLAEKK